MKELLIGVAISSPDTRSLVEPIVAAEQTGIGCVWMTSALASPDPFAVYAARPRAPRMPPQYGRFIEVACSLIR